MTEQSEREGRNMFRGESEFRMQAMKRGGGLDGWMD